MSSSYLTVCIIINKTKYITDYDETIEIILVKKYALPTLVWTSAT